MIGLDTNILVRYIVQDEPRQSKLAAELIKSRCTEENPGYISHIVLVELVWVLDRGYTYGKDVILSILKQIAATVELLLEHSPTVWQAIWHYEQTNVDFADCLLGGVAKRAGCEITYTFDKRAGNLDIFTLVRH